MNTQEICNHIGADSLGYLSVEGMVEASGQEASRLCMACFDGNYPIEPPHAAPVISTLPVSRVPSVYRRRRDENKTDAPLLRRNSVVPRIEGVK